MKIVILLLTVLFPAIVHGQEFAGIYQARFLDIYSNTRMITARFEVKTDDKVAAIVRIDDEVVILLNGSIDKKGRFEATAESDGSLSYQLKGRFDKKEVSFVQRTEEKTRSSKSVSENVLKGTFIRIGDSESQAPGSNDADELKDNGSSWLDVAHGNPLFGPEWRSLSARVVSKLDGNVQSFEIEAFTVNETGEQRLTILFPKYLATKKTWTEKELTMVTYREKSKDGRRNSFVSFAELYSRYPELSGGKVELVKETETQMIFRISKLKIKRVNGPDHVELNGFAYAEKLQ